MPDDDTLIGQNEIDVRNEARNPLNAMPIRLRSALSEERCNGCGKPRSEWGPICSGMTQGDFTHYHSPEWWKAHLAAH